MQTKATNKTLIPFNKPYIDEEVFDYIKVVIDSGSIGGDGSMCKEVEGQLRRLFLAKHALLTTSCSHALEMAMIMLSFQPGDEVITPSFTFVSTANAILRGGGKPVFCDINDQTFTLDVKDFERKISKKTRAVIPVHYAGISAEMDSIKEISIKHQISIVEDAAQGVNAKYRGKYLGTIGNMGAYSFHDTKNYASGEGGAFITGNETYARRGEIIREKGTNRANFLRGEVDKYTWVDHGSSYVLSDILAAVLKYQLDKLQTIHERRRRIYESYQKELKDLEHQEKLRLPLIPDYCESNYHLFPIVLPNEDQRNVLMKKLKEYGIGATFHYIPLHTSPFARKSLDTQNVVLPVTDRIASTLLRLPLYPHLEDSDVYYVIEKVRESLK